MQVLANARRGRARQHIKCADFFMDAINCPPPLANRLTLCGVDQVVRYFQQMEVRDFKQCVPSISISVHATLYSNWPSTCPKRVPLLEDIGPSGSHYHHRLARPPDGAYEGGDFELSVELREGESLSRLVNSSNN